MRAKLLVKVSEYFIPAEYCIDHGVSLAAAAAAAAGHEVVITCFDAALVQVLRMK